MKIVFILVSISLLALAGCSTDVDLTCPEDVAPDKVILKEREGLEHRGLYIDFIQNRSVFADGTRMEILGSDPDPFLEACYKGNKEGQNIHNYYCDSLHYYNEDTSITREGVIGEKEIIDLKVTFELEATERLVNDFIHLSVVSSTCKENTVISGILN